MSRDVETILAELDELPASEGEQVVSEFLRRVALSEHAALSDDELTAAADQVFQDLDRQENTSR